MDAEQLPPLPTTQPPPETDGAMQVLAGAVALATRLLLAALAVLLLVSLLRCYVVVKQHQVGQVYRFGRPVRTLGPGEQTLVFPPPIDEVRMYSVTREQVLESDVLFYALSEAERRSGTPGPIPDALRPGLDGYVLTADRNVVHCQAQLFYQVSDPLLFYERQADGPAVLQALLHQALLQAAARRTIESVLFDLTLFSERAVQHLAAAGQALDLGISVNRLVLRVAPPRQVRDAFDAQIAASQAADQVLKEAESHRIAVLNDAQVQADRIRSEARANSSMQRQQAEARADTFRTLLTQYRQAGGVMRRDLHLSALRRVLENAEEIFLVEEQPGRQLRVHMGRRRDRQVNSRKNQDMNPGE